MKRSLFAMCAAVVVLVPLGAGAQGFDSDAGFVASPQSRPLALDDPRVSRPSDFGDVQQYFTTVDASSLVGRTSGFNHSRTGSGSGIWCAAGSTDSRAVGEFRPPHGAELFFFRYWGVDTVAEDMTVTLDEICQPDFSAGTGDPVLTNKGTIVSTGAGGFFSDSVALAGTADTQSCIYRVTVQFDASTGSCDQGQFMAFYKARVAYFRQISPAPAIATFTDVPVGSQFHAEVEALNQSGITLGCTATEFCPGNFVTRLQMAAFLSRALGLQFDTIVDPANP